MTGKVKGIVVEIGGDTSGLQEALKKVNSMTSSLSKELKGINSLLKFDPKNTELLKQKQALLKEEIQATDTKLQNLLFHQEQVAKSGVALDERQQANYRALQREIVATQKKLQELKNEASGFTQFGDKLQVIGSAMKEFGNKVTEVGKKVSVLSGAVAGLFAIGVKYNAELEVSTKAFETFTGSAEEADKAINNIRKDSRTSIFDTNALVKANQYLISTGVDADKARKTINGLADAIALTGGGNDELNRMALNLQQIQNVGKASATDIRQFAMAGIDVYGVLAETLGVTTQEVKNMDISFEDLSDALIKASSEGGKYYGGQEKMADTLTGKISKLKKTFQELMGSLSELLMPILDKLIGYLQKAVDWFNSLDQSQKDLITKIGIAIVTIGPALIIIGKLISGIGSIISFIGGVSKALGFLGSTVLPIVAKAVTGLFSLIMAHPVVAVITAIIGVLVLLYNKCEWFRNAVNAIVGGIWDFITHIGDNIRIFFTETIPSWIDFLTEIVMNLPYYIGLALGWVLGKITEFGQNAWNWITTQIPKMIDNVVNWFKELPDRIYHTLLMLAVKVSLWFIEKKQQLHDKIVDIIESVQEWFAHLPENLANIGRNIIEGLWNGILNAKDWLLDKIRNFANGIIDGFKNALGIHSPSVLFENVIGKNIALGIEEGFDKNINKVIKDMTGQITGATAMLETDLKVAPATQGSDITINFYPQQMTEAELEVAFNYVNRRFGTAY